MAALLYKILFILASIYICLKTIGYGAYEIKEQKNKPGGLTVIVTSILITLFATKGIWGRSLKIPLTGIRGRSFKIPVAGIRGHSLI